MDVRRSWLVVLGDVAARDIARSDWRRLPLPRSDGARPQTGDRLAILQTHRPKYVASAALIGTADVRRDQGDALEIRHRVVAPPAHEPALAGLSLRVSTGWTHERLGALLGSVMPLQARDHERIEAALLEQARAFGPGPSRPPHRRPRTPGRRALVSERVRSRRLTVVR